jgi:hypothetical protein
MTQLAFGETMRLYGLNHMGTFNGSPTAYLIDASTDWIGGSFVAAATGTIDRIMFMCSTATSPVFELEGAITQLDASDMPLGTDVAVSSTTISSGMGTNTYHNVTISASVTRGTAYGIIIRVKSGTYVSGSCNLRLAAGWPFSSLQFPGSSYRIAASPVALYSAAALGVRYSINGTSVYLPTPGLNGAWALLSTVTTSNHTNKIVANKVTLTHSMTLFGYAMNFNNQGNCTVGTFTAAGALVTGTDQSFTAGLRQWNGNNPCYFQLAAPVLLPPGTYYFGTRADANSSVTMPTAKFATIDEAVLCNGFAGAQASFWNGSTWADETGEVGQTFPILSASPSGHELPGPTFV